MQYINVSWFSLLYSSTMWWFFACHFNCEREREREHRKQKVQHILGTGHTSDPQKRWNHVRIWLRTINTSTILTHKTPQYEESGWDGMSKESQNKNIDTRQKTQSHFWIIKKYCCTMTSCYLTAMAVVVGVVMCALLNPKFPFHLLFEIIREFRLGSRTSKS